MFCIVGRVYLTNNHSPTFSNQMKFCFAIVQFLAIRSQQLFGHHLNEFPGSKKTLSTIPYQHSALFHSMVIIARSQCCDSKHYSITTRSHLNYNIIGETMRFVHKTGMSMTWCNQQWTSGFPQEGRHSMIAKFMGPKWGSPGAGRTQVGPMLATWTLISGLLWKVTQIHTFQYPDLVRLQQPFTNFH